MELVLSAIVVAILIFVIADKSKKNTKYVFKR